MIVLLGLISSIVSNRYVTSCNYDLNVCYYDNLATNVRCEDVEPLLKCKPVHVNLGSWDIKYEDATSWPHSE